MTPRSRASRLVAVAISPSEVAMRRWWSALFAKSCTNDWFCIIRSSDRPNAEFMFAEAQRTRMPCPNCSSAPSSCAEGVNVARTNSTAIKPEDLQRETRSSQAGSNRGGEPMPAEGCGNGSRKSGLRLRLQSSNATSSELTAAAAPSCPWTIVRVRWREGIIANFVPLPLPPATLIPPPWPTLPPPPPPPPVAGWLRLLVGMIVGRLVGLVVRIVGFVGRLVGLGLFNCAAATNSPSPRAAAISSSEMPPTMRSICSTSAWSSKKSWPSFSTSCCRPALCATATFSSLRTIGLFKG
mmetsp:Transcript_36063/g.84765  ORF Transcript_36063/g.84765 Transcript_36063/m.84765 type:complete len:296 (-) Transcript_36063:1084-1971(-)